MAANNAPIRLADLLLPRHIGRLVGDKPCQSREMPRFASGFSQHCDDIRERTLCLPDEIAADQFTALIPADLTGNEYLTPLGGDPVGIALGWHPVLWLQKRKSVLAHG